MEAKRTIEFAQKYRSLQGKGTGQVCAIDLAWLAEAAADDIDAIRKSAKTIPPERETQAPKPETATTPTGTLPAVGETVEVIGPWRRVKVERHVYNSRFGPSFEVEGIFGLYSLEDEDGTWRRAQPAEKPAPSTPAPKLRRLRGVRRFALTGHGMCQIAGGCWSDYAECVRLAEQDVAELAGERDAFEAEVGRVKADLENEVGKYQEKIAKLEEQVNALTYRLKLCLDVAACGPDFVFPKEGDYGYSEASDAVLKLRRERDKLRQAVSDSVERIVGLRDCEEKLQAENAELRSKLLHEGLSAASHAAAERRALANQRPEPKRLSDEALFEALTSKRKNRKPASKKRRGARR